MEIGLLPPPLKDWGGRMEQVDRVVRTPQRVG